MDSVQNERLESLHEDSTRLSFRSHFVCLLHIWRHESRLGLVLSPSPSLAVCLLPLRISVRHLGNLR